jgi:hypothetical protein
MNYCSFLNFNTSDADGPPAAGIRNSGRYPDLVKACTRSARCKRVQ